jgi:hypothetical protein
MLGWRDQRLDQSTAALCSNTYLDWPGSQCATEGGIDYDTNIQWLQQKEQTIDLIAGIETSRLS